MKTNHVYIYALIDPTNNQIRYIGKTINILNRYTSHINDLKDEYPKTLWIKKLIENKLLPELLIIDTVNDIDWEFWEEHYISLFRFYGYDLLNISLGGTETGYINKNYIPVKREPKIIKLTSKHIYGKLKQLLKNYEKEICSTPHLLYEVEHIYDRYNKAKTIDIDYFPGLAKFIKDKYHKKLKLIIEEPIYDVKKINIKTSSLF